MTALNELLNQFESGMLPKSEWTHEAHLRVGLAIIGQSTFDEALCRLRAGIISLNNFHQTPNTATSGYHETMTQFWARVIFLYLAQRKADSVESVVPEYLGSGLASKYLPFHFYQKEEVLGISHRARFISPTKMPLDWENLSKFLNT
jgi:hypothetical protein